MFIFYSILILNGGYCLLGSLPRMFHLYEVSDSVRELYFFTDAFAMILFVFLYSMYLASTSVTKKN